VKVADLNVAVVPVGKVDVAEVEAAVVRAARTLRRPVELRDALGVPPGVEDRERGQFRAATLMNSLRAMVPQLSPGKLVGSDDPAARAPARPDAFLFVTDVDLFTAKTDGVFAAWVRRENLGLVSVRRLREAFYRRKADAVKQRSRLVKELLRVAGRMHNLPECSSPDCVLAPSRFLADVDAKTEGFCRTCSQRMFEGKIQV
jgi:predicted Zn-dependent protease